MNFLLDKIHIRLYSCLRSYCCNLDSATVMKMEEEGYFIKEEYRSNRMEGYYYNYVIKLRDEKEGSIYIGFRLNSYKNPAEGLRYVCVEYNPCKINIPSSLRSFFYNNGYKYSTVKSCDVAIDFPNLLLTDFRIDTQKNLMFVGASSNLTRYISPSSNHCRIKIYDKTKERKRLSENISQTIRVEISLKNPTFHENFFMSVADELYINDIRDSLGEIFIPSSVPTLYNDLIDKYGAYNDAMLYLLEKVDEVTRQDAYALMSSKSAAKYRAFFTQSHYESLKIDPVSFHNQVSLQIRNCVFDVSSFCDYVS